MHRAVSISPEAPAREALRVLLDNNVPGVPVVDARERLVGFVTDGHLLASALPKYLALMHDLSFIREGAGEWMDYLTEAADKPVGEVMSKQVAQVEIGHSPLAAAQKMLHDGVSSVVVTRDGKVAGIVNRLDLYAAIIELKPA